jgi:hypothetical protein
MLSLRNLGGPQTLAVTNARPLAIGFTSRSPTARCSHRGRSPPRPEHVGMKAAEEKATCRAGSNLCREISTYGVMNFDSFAKVTCDDVSFCFAGTSRTSWTSVVRLD